MAPPKDHRPPPPAGAPKAGAKEEEAASTYKCHVPVLLAGHRVNAYLDSGNNWRSAISLEAAKKIGLDMESLLPIGNLRVHTAQEGAYLKVLGEAPKPLALKVRDNVFSLQPMVVDGLQADLNLSGPLMKLLGWTVDFAKGRISDCRGLDCKLVEGSSPQVASIRVKGKHRRMKEKAVDLEQNVDIFFKHRVVVPPRCRVRVELTTPQPMVGSLERILKGNERFEKKHDLHATVGALVRMTPEGATFAYVLNSLPVEKVIPAGACYGQIEEGREFKKLLVQSIQPEKQVYSSKADGAAASTRTPPEQLGPKASKLSEAVKLAWIVKSFDLDNKKCLRTKEQRKAARLVLLKHFDVFSHDGSYGTTSILKHEIKTIPGKGPIAQKARVFSPHLFDEMKAQIDKWLLEGVIEPSNSPWCANMVNATKKDRSMRLCVDWRALNDITIKDKFPMPNVRDCLNKLAGSNIFSGVDMAGAFHCVEIEKKDREKTAFQTPFGLFQFIKLGFGLCNGPPTYCRLVAAVLRDIPLSCAIGFLDDGLIHSKGIEQHIANLDRTLEAYYKAGLRLSPKKCDFFSEQIEYLGHIVSPAGIVPPPRYISTVRDAKIPRLRTEVRAWLGLLNYYRPHIADFASLARPWTELTGVLSKQEEATPIVVTEAMKESFRELTKRLCTPPTLGYPYFKGAKAGQFVLDTDFAKGQIAGVLSQIQDGKEVPLFFGSAKLTQAQQAYASTKGELFAGFHFMKHYSLYLRYGPPFLWRTDNSALTYWKTVKEPPAMITRLLDGLADFPHEVQHRKGTLHTNCDSLSRLPGDYPTITDQQAEEPKIQAIQLRRELPLLQSMTYDSLHWAQPMWT